MHKEQITMNTSDKGIKTLDKQYTEPTTLKEKVNTTEDKNSKIIHSSVYVFLPLFHTCFVQNLPFHCAVYTIHT